MQSIKHARSRSKDPKQEAIRSQKDAWNKNVSRLIDDMIHFKKMVNGYPSKFFQQRSKITEPIPVEPSKILAMIASEFSEISEASRGIISNQYQYSTSRQKRKTASSKLTRFLSYLKGPYFGSSPEALKRRDRVSLLKYASDIYYNFKDLNSDVLKRDVNSIHSVKALFNKLSNNIYIFGSYFKTIEPPPELQVGEPVEIEYKKQPDNKPEQKSEALDKEEVNNLYDLYSKDHNLLKPCFEILDEILKKKGFSGLTLSSKVLNELRVKLDKVFIEARTIDKDSSAKEEAKLRSKILAINTYNKCMIALCQEIRSNIDETFEANRFESVVNYLNGLPEFTQIQQDKVNELTRKSEEERRQREKEHAANIEKQKKENQINSKKNDVIEYLDLLNELLTNKFNILLPFPSKEELLSSNTFELSYDNLINTIIAPVFQIEKNIILNYNIKNEKIKSIKHAYDKLLHALKEKENIPKETPKKEILGFTQNFVNTDLFDNGKKCLSRLKRKQYEFFKKNPVEGSFKLAKYLGLDPKIAYDVYVSDSNLNGFSNESDNMKSYINYINSLKHDFKLIDLDVDSAKSLQDILKLTEGSSSFSKNSSTLKVAGPISKVVDYGRKKLHELTFWEKTSPIRLKLSSLFEDGKNLTDNMMDILENDVDFKNIKMLLNSIIEIHTKSKQLVHVLIETTTNVKYEGDVSGLLSDRYDYKSNLSEEDLEDVLKTIRRQNRSKIVRDLTR